MKKFAQNSMTVAILAVSLMFGLTGPISAFAAGPAGINLGSAGNYAVLAKTGISTTGSTSVVGDMGVSPAAATYITGFALTLPAASAFSTSALVTGKIYAPGYTDPTPSNLTTAVSDMETAYTDGAGRTNPTATELGAGNIGGLTISPGLYKWGTGVVIPADVTLSGSGSDVWIFQIGQYLNVSSGVKVILTGGAQASNVFWVVAGQTTIGTTAIFNGNILDQTAIVLNTGAKLNGRALAQTAVTLDSNAVSTPSYVAYVAVTPVATTTPVMTVTSVPAVPITLVSSTTTVVTTNPSVTVVSNTTANTATNNVTDGGCLTGNKFSITTGNACASYVPNVTAAGCLPGNKFSITTGIICATYDISALPTPASGSWAPVRTIAVDLVRGSRGNSVLILQQFLISQNKGSAAQALASHGMTTYFGVMTGAALAEFQASVGISPALGNFGPVTRGYLKANY